MKRRHLVIIGGGPAGLVIASVAAQLGLKVTLIEKSDKLGGDCLHTGCVPSKTLIQSARVAALIRRGAEFGLEALEVGQGSEQARRGRRRAAVATRAIAFARRIEDPHTSAGLQAQRALLAAQETVERAVVRTPVAGLEGGNGIGDMNVRNVFGDVDVVVNAHELLDVPAHVIDVEDVRHQVAARRESPGAPRQPTCTFVYTL